MGDVLMVKLFFHGREVDFTCISRLANSNMRLACTPDANAATEAEAGEKTRYTDLPTIVIFEIIATKASWWS